MILAGFNDGDTYGFFSEMIKKLFKVGIVGVKLFSYSGPQWSYLGNTLIRSEIDENSTIYIHPTFWRVLGVKPVL